MSETEPTLIDIARETMMLRQRHEHEMTAFGLKAYAQVERAHPGVTDAAREIFPSREEAALWLVSPSPRDRSVPLQEVINGHAGEVETQLKLARMVMSMGN